MNRYFATTGAVVGSIEEINNYATLKAVVEDMQSKKKELGIRGVFASTSLLPSEEWRWHTHLANLPVYAEYQANGVTDMQEISFAFQENFKNIFDLYLQNSTTEPKMLGSKGVNDSMAEFALGQCAMVQNGNWAWEQISGVSGNTVKAEDIKYLPIYTGAEGEEKQGLCIGTENYLAINKNASAEDKKASVEFLEWLFSSEKGKDYVVNKLKFISPFNTFKDDEMPADPLAKEILSWMKKDVNNLEWTFNSFPGQQFKDDFGNALLEYVQGSKDWSHVESAFRTSWKNER
jgi:raffinose/stachyose/melibiose transport system substrate-binding protein